MTEDSFCPTFKSHRDFYHFQCEVLNSRRYIRPPETVAFIHAVTATRSTRESIVKPGAGLRRAQVAHGLRPIHQTDDDGEDIYITDIECAASKARMLPLRDQASDGRVNSCLEFQANVMRYPSKNSGCKSVRVSHCIPNSKNIEV